MSDVKEEDAAAAAASVIRLSCSFARPLNSSRSAPTPLRSFIHGILSSN